MALTEYTVKYDQNIFDVALQLYGDTSGIGDLLLQNPKLNLGSEIKIGDKVLYEPDNTVNSNIVKYFTSNGIVVSNGVGHVYQKAPIGDIMLMILSKKDKMVYDWKISGSGDLYVDWGDDTEIQKIKLSGSIVNISHNIDSQLADIQEYRKIRFYGDFHINELDVASSDIVKIFAIDDFDISGIILSENKELDSIGFFDVISQSQNIEMTNIEVDSLTPLINQELLRDLWINDSRLSQSALDEYFIGLVIKYEARPSCNVRMWGNSSPSGTYQRPDELFNPQTGLEAMWVLENERGWTIQEIITPPLENTINRRFRGLYEDIHLLDEVGGINAHLCLPVSKFVSADSSNLTTGVNASTINYAEFKILIMSLPASEGTIIGAKDNVHGTHFKVNLTIDGYLTFSHGEDSYTSTISINDKKVHTIGIDNTDGTGMRAYLDGVQLAQLANPIGSTDSLVSIGCLRDSDGVKIDFLDALLWDFYLGDNAYIIPLPHLGYDSSLSVKYTVNNIYEEFLCPEIDGISNAGGCDYMHRYGAVARRTNLSLNGYSEKIGDGSLNLFWSEEVSSNYELIDTEMVISCLMKVNQDAKDNGVSCTLTIEYYDDISTLIGSKSVSGDDLSYGSFSFSDIVPTNAKSVILKAFHSPLEISSGNCYIKEISINKSMPEFIPNKLSGINLLPLLSSDVLINGSEFINQTPFMVIFNGGDIEMKEYIWDKSRGDVWNNEVRTSTYYDPTEPKKWAMTELNQAYIVNNISSSFLYIPWIKIDGGLYKDIFQYPVALEGDDKERCNRYVHLYT